MEEIYRSQFRMPYSLYEQLKASADTNHRSVNAELVARLEATFSTAAQPKAVRGINKELLLETLQTNTVEAKEGGEQGLVELFARAILLANEKLEGDQKKPKRR